MSRELQKISAKVEELRDELQAYYDGKSEKWQDGEQATAVEAALEELDNVVNNLSEALQ